MYCMTGFGLVSAGVKKEITSDQVALWDFEKFIVPFGIPKMIVVDVDGLFLECSRRLPNIPY